MIHLDNYIIQDKISEGKFGAVYKGKHRYTGEPVAIKCELATASSKTIKNEANIYLKIGNEPGFPTLKWYGKRQNDNTLFLVIDLLGPSLKTKIEEQGDKGEEDKGLLHFTSIAKQMFRLCEILHGKGLVHRDIKPDNFLFSSSNNSLFLADFGLCIYKERKMPKVLRKIKRTIGSPNYISLNVHHLLEPGFRDDLESCVYVLLFLLNKGRQLWTNCDSIEDIQQRKEALLDALQHSDNPNILVCYHLLNYFRQLDFQDSADFNHIYYIINNSSTK